MHVTLMAIPLLLCCLFLESVFALADVRAVPHLLQCRLCRRAVSLEDCIETQTCSTNEECYMDSIVTPSLQVIYNGGCRSKTVCRAGSGHIGKRAATENVTCSSCCNATNSDTSTQCNINLCGLRAINTHSNECYYCGDNADARQGSVHDPSSCRKIKACTDDEACRTRAINTAGVITHEFSCYPLLQCQVLTITGLESEGIDTGIDMTQLLLTGAIVGRKRQIPVCDICCGDGLCNDAECQSVKSRILTFAKAGRFNYTTLRLIR